MNALRFLPLVCLFAGSAPSFAEEKAGNPVFPGWYADPEGIVFGVEYWIYPTFSAPYDKQLHFDAFSSQDLVTWEKHERILDTKEIKWAKRAMWAPGIIEKDEKYYLFFSANDIQNDDQKGGIGVAVADKPGGPFEDHLGKPLVDKFHHGAQRSPSTASLSAMTTARTISRVLRSARRIRSGSDLRDARFPRVRG